MLRSEYQCPGKDKPWTGLTFQGTQYPSEAELANMPLKDLVALRPRKRGNNKEMLHYANLFSRHDLIRPISLEKIDKEEFIRQWVNVWETESAGPSSQKLQRSIISHLESELVEPDIIKEIKRRHFLLADRAVHCRIRDRRRSSSDPREVERKNKDLERRKLYNRENRRHRSYDHLTQKNAAAFKSMMLQKDIALDLPALALEKQTRGFSDALGGRRRTTVCLRSFLKDRNSREVDLEKALSNRKEFHFKKIKQRWNEQRKLKREAVSLGNGKKATAPAADDARIMLISLSMWWSS